MVAKTHENILEVLSDGRIHHTNEFLDMMTYDGLRGRVSELNKWGYVIARVDTNGKSSRKGRYFKLITVPTLEHIQEVLSIKLKLDKGKNKVRIIPLGDVHYGNPCFTEKSEELLDGYIDYILNTDGVYTVLMGDLLESANERASFNLKITPQEQYEWILDKFQPLADAGKIMAIISGNHENWIFNDKGFNVVKTMSMSMKVPYLGDSGYLGMQVGNQFYTAYIIHPRAGVTKKSTKIKMLEDLGSIHDVDIVICGHIHSIITEEQIIRVPNFITGNVDNRKQLLVGSGSFLEYGDYAEKARYKPEKMGAPKIKLYAKNRDMHTGK